MTTLQKSLVAATIAAAVGMGIYEARQASQLREQNQALQQQQIPLNEQIQQLQRERDDALKKTQTSSRHNPPLRSPPSSFRPTPAASQSFEDLQATNLLARLGLLKEMPKLRPEQIRPYLEKNHRSAESLLAAFQTTGDRAFLFEAMETYPNDPRVSLTAYYRSSSNDFNDAATPERRQWLEAFKTSDSENALPYFLSARDYFKAGKPERALQEFQTGASKSDLQDYLLDSIQNAEEAYRNVGYSLAEAKALASSDVRLKHLTELRRLGWDMVQLADSYRLAGDVASAQAALEMALNLGRQLDRPGAFTLAQSAFAIEIQQNAIRAMGDNSSDSTLKQQLEELNRRVEDNRAGQQRIFKALESLSDQEFISYVDRTRLFGEEAARQWVLSRFAKQ